MSKTAAKGKANKVPGVRFYVIRNVLKEKAGSGDGDPSAQGGILIDELMESYRRCIDTSLAVIHDIAHDMKGQGGTFGYPLITDFGESLYKCTYEAIQAAEAEFQKMSEDYPDWVQSLIDELMESYRRCIDTSRTASREIGGHS